MWGWWWWWCWVVVVGVPRARCVTTRRRSTQVLGKTNINGPFQVQSQSSLHPERSILNQKGPKEHREKKTAAFCAVFEYIWRPNCTMRPKCTFPGPMAIKFASGKVHVEPKRVPKTPKTNGERPMLFLSTFQGLTVHAVVGGTAETPKNK